MYVPTFVFLPLAASDRDCSGFYTEAGEWHLGFDCPWPQHCCGDCHARYCCTTALEELHEDEQSWCNFFVISPSIIAGITLGLFLLMLILTLICCCTCSGCVLSQMRLRRRSSSCSSHCDASLYGSHAGSFSSLTRTQAQSQPSSQHAGRQLHGGYTVVPANSQLVSPAELTPSPQSETPPLVSTTFVGGFSGGLVPEGATVVHAVRAVTEYQFIVGPPPPYDESGRQGTQI
ncbi:uncharacterized protein LOC116947631 [Petromyzon marinus]|uniref:Protein shisa-5-like n=1 Tax=Petromyzon marinus TaxID=7757 RepID=A0AAJ7TKE3_PETMA|nr:protein shisa-5-like [Petromyzon marinus]